jgi:hypothetical protein
MIITAAHARELSKAHVSKMPLIVEAIREACARGKFSTLYTEKMDEKDRQILIERGYEIEDMSDMGIRGDGPYSFHIDWTGGERR